MSWRLERLLTPRSPTSESVFTRLLRIAPTVVLCCLPALAIADSDPPAASEDNPVHVMLIGVVQLTPQTDRREQREQSESFIKSYYAGEPVFNASIRRPPLVDESYSIDCGDLKNLGLLLDVRFLNHDSMSATAARQPRLRFDWRHPDIRYKRKKHTQFRTPVMAVWNEIRSYVYLDTVELKRHFSVDGPLTVTISHLGDALFQQTFDLRGCAN